MGLEAGVRDRVASRVGPGESPLAGLQMATFYLCPHVAEREVKSLSLSLFFKWLHSRHMEIPRLEVAWELQLPAYATATATPDLSRVCHLHHSSRQRQVLNPLSKARDRAQVLMDTSWNSFPLCHRWELPQLKIFKR